MTRASAVSVTRIGCRALTDLVEDPDFRKDLAAVANIGWIWVNGTSSSGQKSATNKSRLPEFTDFLEVFKRAEEQILLKSGVDMDATARIISEIDSVMAGVNQTDFERLPDKIAHMRSFVCSRAVDPEYSAHPDLTLGKDIANAVMGIGIMGVDLGVVTVTEEILDTIVSSSLGFGAAKCRDLISRIW